MVSGCERFYKVESGDSCYNIAQEAGIALSDFYAWNPAVGNSCTGLQANVYVCIGLSGPITTISTGTPVPLTPTPTQVSQLLWLLRGASTTVLTGANPTNQSGMVSSCSRFYEVESGDGCYTIASDAGIALT